MSTFVYVNGRPDHQKGHHDDLIMSTAMSIYVGENSFTSMTKVTEHTKAMIDSWHVETNTRPSSIYFDPVMTENNINKNQPTKSDYQKYLWLFGSR